jgi:uncharacterized membrane protein
MEQRATTSPSLRRSDPDDPMASEITTSRSTGTMRTLVIFVDRAVLRLALHWLLLFNVVFGVYAGLPVLAPLLMSWGQPRLANIIYFVYQFLCHQMPSRCFYIGRFQVGICQRDLALYGGACLAGLVFSVFRKRVRPLPLPVWLVLVAPLVLDGLTQLVGLRSSTWQLRTLSGLLASGATIWLIYPYLEQAFGEAAVEAGHQLGKIEAPGE